MSHDETVDDRRKFQHALQEAVVDLLKPIVGICIDSGLLSNDLEASVKRAFWEVASDKLDGQADNEAVAVLTGLTTSEVDGIAAVTQFRDSDRAAEEAGRSGLLKILSAWERQPEYTGAYGVPLDLPLVSEVPGEVSFDTLSREFGQGIDTRVALTTLQKWGRVRLVDEQTVRHVWEFVVHKNDAIEFATHMRRALKRLGDTVSNNFFAQSDGDRRLEQCQYSDVPLTEEQYEEFDRRVREKVEELFRWSDSWLGAAGKENMRSGSVRFDRFVDDANIWPGIGVFQFVDAPQDAPGKSDTGVGD